jgi:hypothetical protein
MGKVALTDMSTIMMPAKGEATKPEPLPNKADKPFRDYQAPSKEGRDGITIRIYKSDKERLRVAAFQERRTQQSLIDQAIAEFLDGKGY